MKECIPSKIIRGKSSLPWITQEIKRLIRKRDKLYSSYKRTQDHDKRKIFLTLRQQIKSKIKSSYLVYLEGLLGLRDEGSKCDSKRLFSFLGKSKEDQRGISSLNHDSDLITDNTKKSNVLNHQFQSVFTNRSPLSLACLAHMKVNAIVDCGKISTGSNYQGSQTSLPKMPEFEISINGIIKLLGNLKPGKAAGPEKIRPLIIFDSQGA